MKINVKNDDFPARKYSKRRLNQLTFLDKLKIVHSVKVKYESQKDTAKMFGVSHHLVSTLIMKVKKNPKFIEELRFEMEDKQSKVEKIKEAAG